jgi:hypothetical protein
MGSAAVSQGYTGGGHDDTERDVQTLRAEAPVTLAEATRGANGEPGVESALGHLTAARREVRHTYGPIDLAILMGFAHVAAAVYMAHDGPRVATDPVKAGDSVGFPEQGHSPRGP